jgi:hypothetical protein
MRRAYWYTKTVTVELEPFKVANYAVSTDNKTIPLEDIPADTISAMCDDWREAIFKKAGKQDPRLST